MMGYFINQLNSHFQAKNCELNMLIMYHYSKNDYKMCYKKKWIEGLCGQIDGVETFQPQFRSTFFFGENFRYAVVRLHPNTGIFRVSKQGF
jgi:hypothetical protein